MVIKIEFTPLSLPNCKVFPFKKGLKKRTHSNVCLAASTPHVEGHLKPDDHDAQMEFVGPLTQRMLTMVLV